jgi:hypothetical protein
MRKLDIGSNRFTEIVVLDEPGHGNACHDYNVYDKNHDLLAKVRFQNGPVKEFGINGCHQEDLLAIVIDRLESFQAGDFACDDNQEALDRIKEAMKCLNRRTSDRQKRGVEGTNIK